MSEATNSGTTTEIVLPAKTDNQRDTIMDSALVVLARFKKVWDDAKRVEFQTVNTIAAILYALCNAEVYIAVKFSNGKDAGSSSSLNGLIACDTAQTGKGQDSTTGTRLYQALYTFVSLNIGCETQTSKAIVQYAARLARLGYSLKDFNGSVEVKDGVLSVNLDPLDPSLPGHQWSGFYRIKPVHVAAAGDSATAMTPDVQLGAPREVEIDGIKQTVYVPADVQEVVLNDKFETFIHGPKDKNGVQAYFKVRLGRTTMMRVSAAVLAADKAAAAAKEAEEANKLRRAAEIAANGGAPVSEPGKGPQEDRPDGTGQPATTPPAPATPPAAGDTGKAGDAGKPDTGKDAGKDAGKPEPDGSPAAGATPQSGSTSNTTPTASKDAGKGVTGDEGQRNAAARASDAVKPEDMPGLIAAMFAVQRVKDEPARYAHLLTIHATTAGLIRTLGGNDFLANPTDENARKHAKLTSIPGSNANTGKTASTGKGKPK